MSPAVDAFQGGGIGFSAGRGSGSGVFRYQTTALAYSSNLARQNLYSSAKHSMTPTSHLLHGSVNTKVVSGPVVELHLQQLVQSGDHFTGELSPGVSRGLTADQTETFIRDSPPNKQIIGTRSDTRTLMC